MRPMRLLSRVSFTLLPIASTITLIFRSRATSDRGPISSSENSLKTGDEGKGRSREETVSGSSSEELEEGVSQADTDDDTYASSGKLSRDVKMTESRERFFATSYDIASRSRTMHHSRAYRATLDRHASLVDRRFALLMLLVPLPASFVGYVDGISEYHAGSKARSSRKRGREEMAFS